MIHLLIVLSFVGWLYFSIELASYFLLGLFWSASLFMYIVPLTRSATNIAERIADETLRNPKRKSSEIFTTFSLSNIFIVSYIIVWFVQGFYLTGAITAVAYIIIEDVRIKAANIMRENSNGRKPDK